MIEEVPEGWEKVTLENTDERWIVHAEGTCRGAACAIHKRTDHHMRALPQHFRADRALMERTCPHGVGHPDPDDLAFHEAEGDETAGVHGCDGCCVAPPPENVRPTPAQWVGMFLRATDEVRLAMAEKVLSNAAVSFRCSIEGHEDRITYLSARVNDLVSDNRHLVDRYMGANA